jgi:hypothetical protein
VPAVETGSVGAQEPFHSGDEVDLRGFKHQMKVIAHQAAAVNLPSGPRADFIQGGEKP